MTTDNNTQYFYSHGKLLLTGEYLVMQGAKAMALPLSLGQSLSITEQKTNQINWETYEIDKLVFTARFHMKNFEILETTDKEKATYIQGLLRAVNTLNPAFLSNSKGLMAVAKVQFNMNWGFGSSSTLISNISQWAPVDAFELNRMVSKGSGFDIACARANEPIIYQLVDQKPLSEPIAFNPPYLSQLFLVYLNKKMPTEQHISSLNPNQAIANQLIPIVNKITIKIRTCIQLNEFQKLITEHEKLIGTYLHKTPVKDELFSDFQGAIKSLGAWGGDFILTASSQSFEKQKQYFEQKGYATLLRLDDLIFRRPKTEDRSQKTEVRS
jgi:mevalonate kinase